MFVNTRQKSVTYIDTTKEVTCIPYSQAMSMPTDCQLSKRLKYTKETVRSIMRPKSKRSSAANIQQPDNL